ncbi:MAG TPA: Crp/Fnr family transcriptional regulator [bacterium]
MQPIIALKKIQLFKNLGDVSLKTVSNALIEKNYKKSEYIVHEGEESNSFGIVVTGRVKIIKHSIDGKEVILRIITEGNIFGEVAMFDNLPYPASAVAMEDSTIFVFEKNAFLSMIKKEPSIAWHTIMDLSKKLRDTSQSLKEIAAERVERRIASLLLRLGEHYGVRKGDLIELNFPLTRQEIADMCGTTVETAIRVMSRLTKDNIIETTKSAIKINSSGALLKIIENLE